MAYIFKEDELPALIDAKGARERIFFVNKELTNIDDMLAGDSIFFSFNVKAPRRCTCTRTASISISSSMARRRWNPMTASARSDPAT